MSKKVNDYQSKKMGYAGRNAFHGPNTYVGPVNVRAESVKSHVEFVDRESERVHESLQPKKGSEHPTDRHYRLKREDRERRAHTASQANVKSSVANSNKNPATNGDFESAHPRDDKGKFEPK